MSPIAFACVSFLSNMVAAGIGIRLRRRLPDALFDEGSRDVVKSVMGLVATIAALVLGLLIASANSSFRSMYEEVDSMAANIVEIDQTLEDYGPDAAQARAQFRAAMRASIARIWPERSSDASGLDAPPTRREFAAFLLALPQLAPHSEAQSFQERRVLELAAAIRRNRVVILNQINNDLPMPFLVVLSFWLAVLFLGFGLFAHRNGVVLTALLIGSLSVAGAMFLILELNRPFDGLMRVSDASIRNALAEFRP